LALLNHFTFPVAMATYPPLRSLPTARTTHLTPKQTPLPDSLSP
jgi:hypothetical protein